MDPQTVIAKRIARELAPGMLVNLGIGIPTQVANYVPPGVRIYFQSENGLIGTGPIPEQGMAERYLTDAAGQPVSALPGACTFDSAMSFGLIRGGHLDITVLVTELAVISFDEGRPKLLETAPDVSVREVLESTEAELIVPAGVTHMNIEGVAS